MAGQAPIAGLVQGSDDYFYGTTYWGGGGDGPGEGFGTLFKISADGTFTNSHVFAGNGGAHPFAGLVQGGDGYFYGTTLNGGTTNNDYGTVFKLSTNGLLTSLYSFTGGQDGAYPAAGLVQGSDGNLYGTTSGVDELFGARATPVGFGTVFRMSTNGALTTLYTFRGSSDGANPFAALVQGSDGNFYGTTATGGLGGVGTVFRLTIVPEVQSVKLTNSTLSVIWGTEAGATYLLQYSSDLNSTNWINLNSPLTAIGATLSTTASPWLSILRKMKPI